MTMKKFLNNPDDLVPEMLEGLAAAFPDIVEVDTANHITYSKALATADRVTIVSMGGAGHEPALAGLVGPGMLDVCVNGEVFAAPGPVPVVEAIKKADKGKGVLYIVYNHAGDMLTGDLVMKQVAKQGLNVARVNTQEDISSQPRSNADDRRGLVGAALSYKIAAGAANAGKSLDEVAAVVQRFADNMATLAVAARGATHPATGMLLADLGDDEMEIGMGQHGEGGGGRSTMKTADETAEIMLNALLKDLDVQAGEKILLVINGSGATTLMEMLIVFRRCTQLLKDKGIELVAQYVGEVLTVQEQAGFQMFVARLDDEQLGYWNEPANAPYFKVACGCSK